MRALRALAWLVIAASAGCSSSAPVDQAAPAVDPEFPAPPYVSIDGGAGHRLGLSIPPTVYYNGAGAKIGSAFGVQFQSGVTGSISGGKLTLAGGGASFPLVGGDGTSAAVTYALGAADEGLYSDGARSVTLQESNGGYRIKVSIGGQIETFGSVTMHGTALSLDGSGITGTTGVIGLDGNGLYLTSGTNTITPQTDDQYSFGITSIRWATVFSRTLDYKRGISNTGTLLISSTAPTISSGFGGSPSIVAHNGTAAFEVNVGSGGSASTGVVGLPSAATGWICSCNDITAESATIFTCRQTASSTSTATLGNFNTAGAAAAWGANNHLLVSCHAY